MAANTERYAPDTMQGSTRVIYRSGSENNQHSPLLDLCDCVPDEALMQFHAVRSGLTPEQVEERLEQYGPNEVTQEKPPEADPKRTSTVCAVLMR